MAKLKEVQLKKTAYGAIYVFSTDYLPTAAAKYICQSMHTRHQHRLFMRSNYDIRSEKDCRKKKIQASGLEGKPNHIY